MASHILDEVEKVCSNVIILKKGKCIASGKVSELLNEKQILILEADDIELLTVVLNSNSNCKIISRESGQIKVEINPDYNPTNLNTWLFEKGITLSRIERQHRSLESQFLEIVGKNQNL